MTKGKLSWTKRDMGGWFRHEGVSELGDTYTIEKEDVGAYAVWWGETMIAEANNVATAKSVAKAHCAGWTKFIHGTTPIPTGQVEVKLRGGFTQRGDAAKFNWEYNGERFDVVAFRKGEIDATVQDISHTF